MPGYKKYKPNNILPVVIEIFSINFLLFFCFSSLFFAQPRNLTLFNSD
jgi:hypothetical protein